MIRRLLVAVGLTVALIPAWGSVASMQEATTSSDATVDDAAVAPAVAAQAQIQHARLLEHHAKVVDLRNRVAQASLDHQARQASQLGDRAPTETIAPMATIAPVHDSAD